MDTQPDIIYLDNAATTRPLPEAVEAMRLACEACYGNPSSLHRLGLEAERLVSAARRTVADALGCSPAEIIFTSGATESDNTAILSAGRRGGIVTSMAEHPAVLEPVRLLEAVGSPVTWLRPRADGNLDPDEIVGAVTNDTRLLALTAVNNETGAVTPLEILPKLKRAYPQLHIHLDGVQGFLKLPMRVDTLAADTIALSGHKVHAPKGIGVLYRRKSCHLKPLLIGGGQEGNLRSGTEAVPLIAALGAAVRTLLPAVDAHTAHVRTLAGRLRSGCEQLGLPVHSPADASPYIVGIAAPGIPSEVMLHFLEERGIYLSSGSACHRGSLSDALMAQRLPRDRITSALRVSFAHSNTMDEVDRLLEALDAGLHRIRRRR